jgi:hypothetical protein
MNGIYEVLIAKSGGRCIDCCGDFLAFESCFRSGDVRNGKLEVSSLTVHFGIRKREWCTLIIAERFGSSAVHESNQMMANLCRL